MFHKLVAGFIIVTLVLFGIVAVTNTKHGLTNATSKLSYGVNGMLEIRCVDGYKFIVDRYGTRQVMDALGRGVRCGDNVEDTTDEQ